MTGHDDVSVLPGRGAQLLGLVPLAGFVAYGLLLALRDGDAGATSAGGWLSVALTAAAGLLALARGGTVRHERPTWLLVGAGLMAWAASELHFQLVLADEAITPFPTVGDALALAMYPASYIAFVLLARARIRDFHRSLWLDGLVVALGIAALTGAAVLPVAELTGETALAATVNIGYALGDLVLLALVGGITALTGWRPGRPWALLALGLGLVGAADVLFVVLSARDGYDEGQLLDLMWPAGALTVGYAAWQPTPPPNRVRMDGARLFAVPCLAALSALALLSVNGITAVHPVALALATTTLGLVILRLALTLAENQRRLERSRAEAHSDSLTRLGNRRRLMADLEEAALCAAGAPGGVLHLFDLDGFKRFNDSFGHPEGDALLERLAARVRGALEPAARAYRLGGDEFCVLVLGDSDDAARAAGAALLALSERGPGYDITASIGSASFPAEASTVEGIMGLADKRLYADKDGRRGQGARRPRPHAHGHLGSPLGASAAPGATAS